MFRKKQTYLVPIITLVIANVLFGINTILAKVSLETIPPSVHAGARYLLIAVLLLPFAMRTWRKLKTSELLRFSLASFCLITLSALAFNIGLSQTPAYNVAAIWLAGPVVLLLLSVAFLKEKLTTHVFVGITVALVGSAFIIGMPPQDATSDGSLLGNTFIALSVIFNAIGILLSKPLTNKFSAAQVSFMSIFPGAIPLIIFGGWQISGWSLSNASTDSIVTLLVSVILAVVANWLFYWGLRRKEVNGAGVYLYIDPAVTILAGWLVLGEHPTLGLALGAGMVLAGIYMAELHTRKRSHHVTHHAKRH